VPVFFATQRNNKSYVPIVPFLTEALLDRYSLYENILSLSRVCCSCVAQRRETSLSLSNVHFPSEVVGADRIVANLAAASSIG
jgi:hypothetical protein